MADTQPTLFDSVVNPLCKFCGQPSGFGRHSGKPKIYCSIQCKAAWQRAQKPVDRDWLYQRYVVEGLGTGQIAKLVNRNPKQVWHWLRGYGIPLRERQWSIEPDRTKYYQNAAWLITEYAFKGRTSSEIASDFDVSSTVILFFLKKHGISTRGMSETRAIKHWGAEGERNPMFGKRGEDVPNWKGGFTPERQAFYSTNEWRRVAKFIKKRDGYCCQRCGRKKGTGMRMEIHHIVSFSVRELRADPNNLVYLCMSCHDFVHSKANVKGDFIRTLEEEEFIRVD